MHALTFLRRSLKKIVFGIVLLLLAGSIAVNIGLYRGMKSEFREKKSVRLDPIGLNRSSFPATLPADASAKDIGTPAAPISYLGNVGAMVNNVPTVDAARIFPSGEQAMETTLRSAL